MHNTNLLGWFINALQKQGIVTILTFIAAATAAVNTEITRRQTNTGANGLWGAMRNGQILLLLTAGLAVLSFVEIELRRRSSEQNTTTIDAVRHEPGMGGQQS